MRGVHILLVLLLLPLLPRTAAAHLKLNSSSPAAGDTIRAPLRTVVLTFSQPVELRFTDVMVINAQGDTLHGALAFRDSTRTVAELTLPADLESGDQRIVWRTAAADGHVVRGTIAFTIDLPAVAAVVSDPVVRDTTKRLPVDDAQVDDSYNSAGWVITRALHFAFVLLAIGGVVFPLLLHRAGLPEAEWLLQARRIALLSAAGALLMAGPRLVLQSRALELNGPAIRDFLQTTDWGHGWLLQVLSAAALLLTFFVYDGSAFATLLALFGALGLAVAAALSGHAAAEPSKIIAVLNDALHVLAAGAWLGTLAYVLAAGVIPALRSDDRHAGLARLVIVFSPMALLAAAVTVLAGLLSALSHIGPSELFSTVYGRALVIKLVVVALVFAVGYYNWKRVKPILGSAASTARLRRSALLELALASVVIVVTAFLVALPTP